MIAHFIWGVSLRHISLPLILTSCACSWKGANSRRGSGMATTCMPAALPDSTCHGGGSDQEINDCMKDW